MKKELKKFIIVLGFCSVVFYTPNITAQQNDAIKQQEETQFQKYTPAQIKEKIKELGLTDQEFQQRAKALGLDAQQYLDILAGKSVEQKEDTTIVQWEEQKEIKSAKQGPLSKHLEDSLKLAEKMLLDSIPGFYGRPNAKGYTLLDITYFNMLRPHLSPSAMHLHRPALLLVLVMNYC